jgi:hypothetical protein
VTRRSAPRLDSYSNGVVVAALATNVMRLDQLGIDAVIKAMCVENPAQELHVPFEAHTLRLDCGCAYG